MCLAKTADDVTKAVDASEELTIEKRKPAIPPDAALELQFQSTVIH